MSDDDMDASEQFLESLSQCECREGVLDLMRAFLNVSTVKEDYSEQDFGTWRSTCSNPHCTPEEDDAEDEEGLFLHCPSCGFVEDEDFAPCFSSSDDDDDDYDMSTSTTEDAAESLTIMALHNLYYASYVHETKMGDGLLPPPRDPFEGVSVVQMAHVMITSMEVDATKLFAILSKFACPDSECGCGCSPLSPYSLGTCDGYCDEEHDGDDVECTADASCQGCHGTRVCFECGGWGTPISWESYDF